MKRPPLSISDDFPPWEVMNRRRMALLLGISVSSLSNWALSGELPTLRPGAYARYRVAETRQHIAKALGDPDPGDLKAQTTTWIMHHVDRGDIGAIWAMPVFEHSQRLYGKPRHVENVAAFLEEHLNPEQLQRYRSAVEKANAR